MITIETAIGQPEKTAIYTNRTSAASLAFYRGQIALVVETASCSDGLDDDGDGFIDHPADPGCSAPNDDSEVDPPGVPALAGAARALLVAALVAVALGVSAWTGRATSRMRGRSSR